MNNRELLNRIISDFFKLEGVKAIALAGSEVSGTPDSASDYDVYIYCDRETDVEERRKIANKYALDAPEINNQYWETGDEWKIKEIGRDIDIMYRSMTWIEEQIDRVWVKKIASVGYTTCFIYNVRNSEILKDTPDGWFEKLRRIACAEYSHELSQNIIDKNLPLLKDKKAASYSEQIEKAIKRGDLVSVNHRIAAFLASYFDVLFAVNRVLHPGEKNLIKYAAANCKVLPENFETDLNALLTSTNEDILRTINDIVKNIKNLI